MEIIIKIFIGLVAFIHCYILWFEMFAWDTRGKKVFKTFPEDLFGPTKKSTLKTCFFCMSFSLVYNTSIQSAYKSTRLLEGKEDYTDL